MGNLCCTREHSVQFLRAAFFYTVKLHCLTYSVWGPLTSQQTWIFSTTTVITYNRVLVPALRDWRYCDRAERRQLRDSITGSLACMPCKVTFGCWLPSGGPSRAEWGPLAPILHDRVLDSSHKSSDSYEYNLSCSLDWHWIDISVRYRRIRASAMRYRLQV